MLHNHNWDLNHFFDDIIAIRDILKPLFVGCDVAEFSAPHTSATTASSLLPVFFGSDINPGCDTSNPLSVNELCVVLTARTEVRVSERVGERRPRQTRCVIIVHS